MQFIRNGGQFKKTKVLGIRPNGGTTVLNTSTGEITTQKTVIAAGAFSAQLTEQLGDKIPLQQERGYHLRSEERRVGKEWRRWRERRRERRSKRERRRVLL